jgi:hypothetical protein
VACYLSEALIAEGSVSAACNVMQAAVERCIAAATNDAAEGGGAASATAHNHIHVTLACSLAVAGATSPELWCPHSLLTHAPLPGLHARAKEALKLAAEEQPAAAAMCRAYIALR